MVVVSPEAWNKLAEVSNENNSSGHLAGEVEELIALGPSFKTQVFQKAVNYHLKLIQELKACRKEVQDNAREIKDVVQNKFKEFMQKNAEYEKSMLTSIDRAVHCQVQNLMIYENDVIKRVDDALAGKDIGDEWMKYPKYGADRKPTYLNVESMLDTCDLSKYLKIENRKCSAFCLMETEETKTFEDMCWEENNYRTEDITADPDLYYYFITKKANLSKNVQDPSPGTSENDANTSCDNDEKESAKSDECDVAEKLSNCHLLRDDELISEISISKVNNSSSESCANSYISEGNSVPPSDCEHSYFQDYFKSIGNYDWLAKDDQMVLEDNSLVNEEMYDKITLEDVEDEKDFCSTVSGWFSKSVPELDMQYWLHQSGMEEN